MSAQHYLRGTLLFQTKQYRLAAEEFRQQLQLVPNDSGTHAMLALCLNALKEHNLALSHAEEAVRADPTNGFAFSALAQTLIASKRLDEAEVAIREAIRLFPQCADYFGILAAIRFDKCHHDAALAATDAGLQLDPENALCLNLRGLSLAHLGNRHAAQSTMDSALARRPEHAYTHAAQGWVLLRQAKVKQSIEHFLEALRIEPGFEWARSGLLEAIKSRTFVYRKLSKGLLAPVFNLLVWFDPVGRYALTPSESTANKGMALCLLLASGFVVASIAFGELVFLSLAAIALVAMIQVSQVFSHRAGWPRAAVISAAMAYIAWVAAITLSNLFGDDHNRPPIAALLFGSIYGQFWAIVIGGIVANRLARRDGR